MTALPVDTKDLPIRIGNNSDQRVGLKQVIDVLRFCGKGIAGVKIKKPQT